MLGPVLLVHDDVAVIAPAQRVLRRRGIEALVATNAADAIITFGDRFPPVVVLAPQVDGGRGPAILAEIRNHPRGAPRFVLLGHGLAEAAEAPVLEMPLDGGALLDAVERALEGEVAPAGWNRPEAGEPGPAQELFADLPPDPEGESGGANPWCLQGPADTGSAEAAPRRRPAGSAWTEPAPDAGSPPAAEAGLGEARRAEVAQRQGLQQAALAEARRAEVAQRQGLQQAALAEAVRRQERQEEALAEEQARIQGDVARLEAQAAEVSGRREAARRALEAAEGRLVEARAAVEVDERRVAEVVDRLERAVAEIARAREGTRLRLGAAEQRLLRERSAREEEEKRAAQLLEAAEAEIRERSEVARRLLRSREEQVRREQEERRWDAEALSAVEEPAGRTDPVDPAVEARKVRPFAAGRWRGPRRVTEVAQGPSAGESAERKASPETGVGPARESSGGSSAAFPPRGTLARMDGPTLLCRALEARLTGRVDVAGSDAQRTLWFEEGRLVAADSSALVERLEDLALRSGLVTAAQHHALRTSEERQARRLALQMVELGYIRPSEMVPLVCRRVQEVAWTLFLDEDSPFVQTPEPAPADERVVLPAHPYALATEGIRRKFSAERLWARMGGPSTLLRPRAQGVDLDLFGLTARERRLAGMVDGLCTLEEVLLESGVEEATALRVLYALVAAGAVEVAVVGRAAYARTPREAAGLDMSRVVAKYAQVRGGDYFQILGLRRDATAYEVREAYERLAREMGADRFVGLDDAALAARLQEIGRALAEAADVLADDQVREEYARNLCD